MKSLDLTKIAAQHAKRPKYGITGIVGWRCSVCPYENHPCTTLLLVEEVRRLRAAMKPGISANGGEMSDTQQGGARWRVK